MNTDGFIANKISVIEQLAYNNKVIIIVLQEIYCTTADKLVTPNRIFARAYCPRPNNVYHAGRSMLVQRVRDPLSLLHPSPSGV